MARQKEEEKDYPVPSLVKREASPTVQKQNAQQRATATPRQSDEPVIAYPRMQPHSVVDKGSFRDSRMDPVLSAAARRGERPPTSVLRSDGVMRRLIGAREGGALVPITDEGTDQPINQDMQEGLPINQDMQEGLPDNPVIPVPRYVEAPDKTANSLGFKRMIDTRGNVPENHLGTYTNLGNDQFNSEMERMNSVTPQGGGFKTIPTEQMNAEISGRRITGKLPSGGTYTYHLKPGQKTAEQQFRQEQQSAQRGIGQFDGSLHTAKARNEYEKARKQNLLNELATYFKDSDPELAAEMLGVSRSKGVIDTPEYGVFSEKLYDEYGNVSRESPIFYQKNSPGRPTAYRAEDVLQGQPQTTYQEALQEAMGILATNPEYREEIEKRLSQAYADQFNAEHLN